jgi:hypothetical protein
MELEINGHELSLHNGHYGNTLIYIDNKLASNGKDVRPDKRVEFWKQFLKDNPEFDSKCLLPAPFNTGKTFEDLY